MDQAMTTGVFYDPQNKQITVAVEDVKAIIMSKEPDGSYTFTFEGVEDIEFFWPDERIWRAVK